MSERIAILGLGFVGLTTALGLAEKGKAVIGFDADAKRNKDIASRIVPFHEPGLDTALAAYLGNRFQVAGTLAEAVRHVQTIFLCVGTPCGESGAADLSILLDAIRQIIDSTDDDNYRLLVVKSTVPPGSSAGTIRQFVAENIQPANKRFGIASNPEFLREGYSWDDFVNPDRIVLGVTNDRDWTILSAVYDGFDAPTRRVTLTEAEFIKYLSNTLLATMISFSNEMSMLAERVGDIDIQRTFGILHQDKRWSGNPAGMATYVYPGCGYGGYCLPKDTQALAYLARSKGLSPRLLEEVINTNNEIKISAADRIAASASPETVIGVLGLSFKPDSDDVRDSPARDIIAHLLERGYKNILAHDPIAIANYSQTFAQPIQYRNTLAEMINEAGILVIATAWNDYKGLRTLAGDKPVIDLRYCLA